MSPHESKLNPRVVTLGTAGGPRYWSGSHRTGIATAVVVGSAVYLVDAGDGAAAQMARAGLSTADLRGIFITHLHSDHTIDLNNLLVFGAFAGAGSAVPVRVLGPGNRGALPPSTGSSARAPLFPEDPTPGTREMVQHMLRAHATDLNDRLLDALRPSPLECFAAEDIVLPDGTGFDPNVTPTPNMEPFEVFRDDLVTVTATLVEHPPLAPAFAFRFDTAEGSVTISGDTRPCDNLVRLAAGTDLLLHEVIDMDWAEATFGSNPSPTAQAALQHHRRSHTTPEEAGAVAQAAGAKALLLHHLVPANAAPAVWARAGETFDGALYIPDDLDTFPFKIARDHSSAAFEASPSLLLTDESRLT